MPDAPPAPARRLPLGARIARLPRAMAATRARRVGLWGAALAGLVGSTAAVGTMAASGAPPTDGLRVALDLAAIGAVALGYLLLIGRTRTRAQRQTAPLETLWWLLLFAAALWALEGGFTLLVDAVVDPKTRFPQNAETAAVATLSAVAEGLFVAGLLAGLRPLVLYRRRRLATGLWTALLVLLLGVALSSVADYPGQENPRLITEVLLGLSVAAAVGCAFRQGWVGVLTLRQRAVAAASALALAVALVGLIVVRADAARAAIAGALSASDGISYAAAVSVPVDAAMFVVLIAGVLYALTAALVLLFQIPTSEALAQRAGERGAMQVMAGLAGQGLDVDSLARAVARAPVEAGLADAAWVALPQTAAGTLRPRIAGAHPLSPRDAARAADARALAEGAAGAALVIEHAAADHRVRARPGGGVGSLVAVRLGAGPEAGTLVVARRAPEAFQPDDVAALETFAAQGGLALANARLFAEALEREAVVRELAVAREVQQRLLPASLPEVPGVRMAAAETPAQTVGGDYYDAVALDEACVGVVVADVSGKGAGAAFYMAEMKGIFQAASRLTRSPSEFLCRANEALAPSLRRGAFVSAAYGVLDAEAGTLALARAGHCPPLLVRQGASGGAASGGAASGAPEAARTRYVRPDGLALGLDAGPLFRRTLAETRVDLTPGDVVLLYTDGLVEARAPASGGAPGEAYGYDRLARTAARLCEGACDPVAIRDALLADLAAFTGDAEPDDDVTLVVLAWNPTAA